MRIRFSASMMCANYAHLEQEIRELEDGGVDAFHVDIMDGTFVPNFGMGIHDLRYIRTATKKSVEAHLMVQEPRRHLNIFIDSGVDVLYVHPESEYHPSTTLQTIIEAGVTPGIAINPGTSVESVLELLHIVKRVLVMSVNPGHAGQIYLPYVGRKIGKLLAMKEEYGIEIFWDGACTVDKIQSFAPLGVNGFVLGTATLFGHGRSYGEILSELRECVSG
ncbi:MAG: ribulose-phosphate 3-epimerase [Clostridiales Family XIII bacterium]|nr:ribulose-phosphate 3-epimerase [Clostridiales Family XIII bacterium]